MNIVEQLEQAQVEKLAEARPVPDFSPGDTVRVRVKVVEGTRERIQAFEGVCIARRNRGINSSFTVRKISYGEGVERIFPLYSPRIDGIDVVRRGDVRRAKLYYLRGLRGKRARIAEKTSGYAGKVTSEEKAVQREQSAAAKAAGKAAAAEAKAAKPKAKARAKTKTAKPETEAEDQS